MAPDGPFATISARARFSKQVNTSLRRNKCRIEEIERESERGVYQTKLQQLQRCEKNIYGYRLKLILFTLILVSAAGQTRRHNVTLRFCWKERREKT
jgi:hypothetical protein